MRGKGRTLAIALRRVYHGRCLRTSERQLSDMAGQVVNEKDFSLALEMTMRESD